MGLRNSFRGAAAELAQKEEEDDTQPAPRGTTAKRTGASYKSKGYNSYKPPEKKMQLYWAAYIEDSLIRTLINTYAREVVEPGWWVEADSDDTAKKMAEWLREAAIIEGETGHDVLLLIRKLVKQRYIRGTSLVEHVPPENDNDTFDSLQLLNPGTITAFTKPSSNILWPPKPDLDTEKEDKLDYKGKRKGGRRRASFSNVPKNEKEEFCAYAQFYESSFNQPTALFTREQMTKFPKDADVGDIYGNTPLESIIERLQALRKKVSDRDQAIEQKAWPTWIFQFGPEDDPWHPDDIDDFAENEDEDSFTPGTKHFVQGDIGVEVVGGRGQYSVPDIENPVEYDVDHIADGLPAPKFVSAHAKEISKQIVIEQKHRFGKKVRELRREIEYRFRRILIAKAEQEGWETKGLTLRIAPPEGEDPDEYEERGTTIRYVSTADKEGEVGDQRSQGNPESQNGGEGSGNTSEELDSEFIDYPEEYDTLSEAVDDSLGAIAD